jgi:YidC/Oxa1 family membrane protein insertase
MFNFLAKGFLGFIFWLNNIFHDFGLTIIFFTLILKIAISPIEFLAFLEEEKMKKLRPKINETLKKYKNDFKKQAEILAQLYKEANYNPFYNLFIQLLPLPIFFSIFFALNLLLKTPNLNFLFLGNIDLTQKNIYLVLVIILLQILSLKNLPKEQRNFSLILFGLIILVLFQFPALFSLYWLTNLLLALIEKVIFLKLSDKGLDKISPKDDPRQ